MQSGPRAGPRTLYILVAVESFSVSNTETLLRLVR